MAILQRVIPSYCIPFIYCFSVQSVSFFFACSGLSSYLLYIYTHIFYVVSMSISISEVNAHLERSANASRKNKCARKGIKLTYGSTPRGTLVEQCFFDR